MSKNWLLELETRVQDAAARLRELRNENTALLGEIASLKAENENLTERAEQLEADLNELTSNPSESAPQIDPELEARNEELAARVGELEQELEHETRELLAQKAQLEERVAELEALLASATDPAAESWQQERDEIRERVARLVDHLGQLLDE